MTPLKRHPTLEIYQPPFRRSNSRENIEKIIMDTKELCMNELENSKCSISKNKAEFICKLDHSHQELQQPKPSGNTLRRPKIPASELLNNCPVNTQIVHAKTLPQKIDGKGGESCKNHSFEQENCEDKLKIFTQLETLKFNMSEIKTSRFEGKLDHSHCEVQQSKPSVNTLRRPNIPASELLNFFSVNTRVANVEKLPQRSPRQKNDGKENKSANCDNDNLKQTQNNFDKLKKNMQQETAFDLETLITSMSEVETSGFSRKIDHSHRVLQHCANTLRRPNIPASELLSHFSSINTQRANGVTLLQISSPQKNHDKGDKSTNYESNNLEQTQNDFEDKLKAFIQQETTFISLSPKCKENIGRAMKNPNQVPILTLMNLVEFIMEYVLTNIKYSKAAAEFCISIIQKEGRKVFIEYFINTCKKFYQARDEILRGKKTANGTRFTAFISLLTEMYIQLKIHQLWNRFPHLQVDNILLSILANCCQSCVSWPITDLAEVECLLSVFNSIGRDLESELPKQLEQLQEDLRDSFLASCGLPSVQRILLQLIELQASDWQLPKFLKYTKE